MQRPINTLIEVPQLQDVDYKHIDYDFKELQDINLKSALAFSALTTKSGAPETELYENIVQIPHYESKWLQLIDREDEIAIVKENLDEFRAMYKPLIESDDFSKCMRITDDGVFELVDDSPDTRISLMNHINDNCLQNLDGTLLEGMKRYHKEDHEVNKQFDKNVAEKIKKDPLELEDKHDLAASFVNTSSSFEEQKSALNKSLDKILVRHRNTKIFLFMLSGPFFLVFMFAKYTIKIIVLLYLHRMHK